MEQVDRLEGIDHLALGGARVNASSVCYDSGGGSVEVLILQLALPTAIYSESEVGAKGLDVEEVHALADLLIGGEADADLPVRELWMC